MKIKKIIISSIVTIITLLASNKVIYAGCDGYWNYNLEEALQAEIATYDSVQCPSGKKTTCKVWNSGNEESRTSNVDIYNENKIVGYDYTEFKNAVLAGTFIGIDAYETYKKKIKVEISAKCTEYKKECGHKEVPCKECGGTENKYICECATTACEPDMNECYGEAKKLLETLTKKVSTEPSFEGVRRDVNDIKNTKEIIVKEDSSYIDRGSPICSGTTCTQTVTIEYTYNLGPAWIDPLTGNVKYEGDTEEEKLTETDKETYIKVPSDLERGWLYFVPLNAKSTDYFDYVLRSKSGPNKGNSVYGKGLCENIIDKYNDENSDEYWGDMLLDLNGNKLSLVAKTQKEAKKKVSNGCLMVYTGKIKIVQKFYNEKDNTLKGYNFYYRPIDYTEPFPNGLLDDSYWKDVYDESTNAVTVKNAAGITITKDLDESFKTKTYATNSDYKLNKIRNYNKDNLYTDWKQMQINGTSSFISANNGITRYACQSYYALGCGPANADWQECQNRQTEVCKE